MRSRATSGPDSAESAPPGDRTPSLWRPLRTPIFRNLLIADVMSDIGTSEIRRILIGRELFAKSE